MDSARDETLKTIKDGEWVIRTRIPQGSGPHPVMLLLHGWTGDENAMWIFSSRLPRQRLLLAPRGLYPTPLGGYSWHPYNVNAWPWVDDFRSTINALLALFDRVNLPEADFSQLELVGFSQGAALAYTFALLHPERVTSLAGLSGFLPEGAATCVSDRCMLGKPVFVAHGTEDDLVPVERARQGVEFLQQAGASVTYCEDKVGHKLSASCFRGLEVFFKNQSRGRCS